MNALCGEKGSGGERGKAHPVTRKAAVAGEGRGLPGGRWAGAGCGHPVWALPGTWRLRPRAPAVTSAGPTETPHAAAMGPGQTGGRGRGGVPRRGRLSSLQSLSRVCLFATPCIAAGQASLFITISRSSLRLTSIESVMPSSHLILCRSLLLLPPIPPSIKVFSNESTLCKRWPKYWSFSFSIIPSKEIPGLISEWTGWISL